MGTIAVRLEPLSIHIRAPRRLAFQVLFDTPSAAADSATRVLSREDGRLLVEFHTEGPGLMGGRKVYRTVEWVTPHEPDPHRVRGRQGPSHLAARPPDPGRPRRLHHPALRDRVRHLLGVAGWLLAVLAVRRVLRRLVRAHLREMKQTIEERAERSRVFSKRCVHDAP